MNDEISAIDPGILALGPAQDAWAPPEDDPVPEVPADVIDVEAKPAEGAKAPPLVFRWFQLMAKPPDRARQIAEIVEEVVGLRGAPKMCFVGDEGLREATEAALGPEVPVVHRGQVGPLGMWFGYPPSEP
jgi:hypothetical protein